MPSAPTHRRPQNQSLARRRYAKLSKLAYLAGSKRGRIDRSLARQGLSKYVDYVPDLSDANQLTFFDKQRGKAVVAFRGTQLNNARDLFTDVAIFFGVERLTPRFRAAVDTAERARKRYGKDNVEFTGHSLGGTQALYATNKTGLPSYAFNPGKGFERYDIGSKFDTVASLFGSTDRLSPSNATIYTTGLDPISFASHRYNANTEFVRPTQLDVHGIDNFIR